MIDSVISGMDMGWGWISSAQSRAEKLQVSSRNHILACSSVARYNEYNSLYEEFMNFPANEIHEQNSLAPFLKNCIK